MDPIARMVAAGAAGAAGSGPGLYVDDLFSTFLYTGTDSTQTINNGIDLAGEGGLVWIKRRDYAYSNVLFDTERGVHKRIYSNNNSSESSNTATVTSFNSDGFSIGDNSFVNSGPTDPSGPGEHVSWTFRKAPGFFDVVTYTGNGVSGQTISHSLGSVPGFIIIKNLDETNAWNCWHRGVTSPNSNWWQNYLTVNTTNAAASWTTGLTAEPTSTSFTVGTGGGVNNNNINYVAYLFAHDDQSFGTSGNEAIIKCGSYTGNGSTTGPEIDLGFEPQFVLLRCTLRSGGYGGGWYLLDSMRGIPTGARDNTLQAQESNSEDGLNNNAGNAVDLDLTPTGFKITTDASSSNESGANYIYMAIRRPHKPPTAATEVFDVSVYANGSTSIGFVPDTNISKWPDGSQDWFWNARLLGDKALNSDNTDPEDTTLSFVWDQPTNTLNFGSYNGYYANYVFRRAPGFFDVVAYTGGVTNQSITHNLGVKPDFIITKARNNSTINWICYHSSLTANNYIRLNTNQDRSTSGSLAWNSTEPTSTQFTLGNAAWDGTNYNGTDYIAYLFASLNGISKVGSYTGTGSNINVDCGFTAGARFVLIKRTDSSGDWYLWDTARGIVSGNDPYLLLNESDAQVTNTDYIDPLNAGFTVTSSAPAALNASGGTYIFLAIA